MRNATRDQRDLVNLNVLISRDQRERLKILAAHERTDVTALVRQWIDEVTTPQTDPADYIAEYRERRATHQRAIALDS